MLRYKSVIRGSVRMWTWVECEDFEAYTGDVRVVDDWGAAAHRRIRVEPGAVVSYPVPEQVDKATISVRYRLLGDEKGTLNVCGREVELRSVGNGYEWISLPLPALGKGDRITMEPSAACDLDGFFIHDEVMVLPDNVNTLDEMVGKLEIPEPVHITDIFGRYTISQPDLPEPAALIEFPSDTARRIAGEAWPVLEALAKKPNPYIVKAYDVDPGTDYNSDYSWHALDKEKLWDIPSPTKLGIVNPNSNYQITVGFSFDEEWRMLDVPFRSVLHIVDTLVYEVDLHPDLRCEVIFRCVTSDTVQLTIHIANSGETDRRVISWIAQGIDSPENPPTQRWRLPRQKFGSGVTTTAGGPAWLASAGPVLSTCFYEWIRGRCRGRRLLASALCDVTAERYQIPDSCHQHPPVAIGSVSHPIVVPAGEAVTIRKVYNMHRFCLNETWNPELTPELYRHETEREAVEAGYKNCAEAVAVDFEESLKQSIEPYKSFPKISLPEPGWDTYFYSCLELPRASTFSPTGSLATPFYNFCRVHAHEPFGWWSYGMHAHESLSTLFTNIADPGLSADFLRGQFQRQFEDGRYPYGVNHIEQLPIHAGEEATAPMIVWEAWNVYLWLGSRRFLEQAYRSGKRSHEWWLGTRDRSGDGLCHWVNVSGESVRDDDGLPTWQATGGGQNQAALDLNCYLLVQERTLALMAAELGLGEDAARFNEMAEKRVEVMNERMWHEEDQCYYGFGETVPGWARVKDISTFFPLWSELATEGRVQPIVDLLDDPNTFGLPYGPPTLARNEPDFGPEKHWYGSNWVEMSLFPILGLRSYGYHQKAADLAYQNTKMVFDELARSGHFREYFNSETGEGVDLIDYIWTATPAYFIVNVCLGICLEARQFIVFPSLPTGWDSAEISELRIRGKRVSVRVCRSESAAETTAVVNGAPVDVVEDRGVCLDWDQMADDTVIEITQHMDALDL